VVHPCGTHQLLVYADDVSMLGGNVYTITKKDTESIVVAIKETGLEVNGDKTKYMAMCCRSQWSRGLRRSSAAARLLRSWVRIPPGAWMFVCCECCVLSGRGLWDELITRPEESYRL